MRTRALSLILAVLAIALPALAGEFAASRPPADFRGMVWGTRLQDIPDMVPVPDRSYRNTYFRREEPLTFGEADLMSVAYYFRKDRLYRVGVAFKGEANHFLIRERLMMRFGPGRRVGSRYGWMWPDFSVEVRYDRDTDIGGLYYTFEGKLPE